MGIFYKTISDATSTNTWSNSSPPMLQHVGEFTLRAGNRYLDVKLSYATESAMLFFYYWGYLYNSANCFGYAGGYPYTTTSILNKYIYNNGSTTLMDIYKTGSPYYVCLKFDRQGDGYSEGKINIFIGTHGLDIGSRVTALAYIQNQSATNYYT